MRLPLLLFLFALLTLSLVSRAGGHGYPDLPVRASFDADRSATIAIEIDLRCFVEDPANEPYVLNWVLEEMTEEEKEAYRIQARDLLEKSVEIRFDPAGSVIPEFEFAFTKTEGAPLKNLDDPVMITATWRDRLPEAVRGYQLHAPPGCRFGVVFDNRVRGNKIERVQVLFPGETSYRLDVTGNAAPVTTDTGIATASAGNAGSSNFATHLRAGFFHIIPAGLMSILFIVGLFLLTRKRRPLLWQIGVFTVAHSLTLALATLGLVTVPASLLGPLLAASVAVIAIGNMMHTRCSRRRLLLVFVFGLVHGFGFAAGLAALEPAGGSLLVSLLGFNAGIELAQLAVIALTFVATAWLYQPAPYRKFVVLPGSAALAFAGLYWVIAPLIA